MIASATTKFAIYDPDTKTFVGKQADGGFLIVEVKWTDDLHKARAYVNPKDASDLAVLVQKGFPSRHDPIAPRPNAFVTKITVTVECDPSPEAAFDIRTTAKYKKRRAEYDKFLPAFVADAEAMSAKDWETFKKARNFLSDLGEPVER